MLENVIASVPLEMSTAPPAELLIVPGVTVFMVAVPTPLPDSDALAAGVVPRSMPWMVFPVARARALPLALVMVGFDAPAAVPTVAPPTARPAPSGRSTGMVLRGRATAQGMAAAGGTGVPGPP